MYGTLVTTAAIVSFTLYCLCKTVVLYFRDAKSLRKYPNLDLFAGLTDLSFMRLSKKGFRSKKLQELHAKAYLSSALGQTLYPSAT